MRHDQLRRVVSESLRTSPSTMNLILMSNTYTTSDDQITKIQVIPWLSNFIVVHIDTRNYYTPSGGNEYDINQLLN